MRIFIVFLLFFSNSVFSQQKEGVEVQKSRLLLLPASTVERSAGQQYQQMMRAAAQRGLLNREKYDFLQINYSLAERESEKRLLEICRNKGLAVIANRPFAEGAMFRRVRGRPLPPWAAEIGCASWAQVLLKFVLSHPAVTCAIPGAKDVAQMTGNARAGEGTLNEDELERLDGVMARW